MKTHFDRGGFIGTLGFTLIGGLSLSFKAYEPGTTSGSKRGQSVTNKGQKAACLK